MNKVIFFSFDHITIHKSKWSSPFSFFLATTSTNFSHFSSKWNIRVSPWFLVETDLKISYIIQSRKSSLTMVCSLSRDVPMKTLSVQILKVRLALVRAYSYKTLMDEQKYEITTALPGRVHKRSRTRQGGCQSWASPEHYQIIRKPHATIF